MYLVLYAFSPTYSVILKDDLWGLNFVLLSSISHYVLSLLHSSPREQPPRRLWDEPASVYKHRDREVQGPVSQRYFCSLIFAFRLVRQSHKNKDKTVTPADRCHQMTIIGRCLRTKNFIANNCFTVVAVYMTIKNLLIIVIQWIYESVDYDRARSRMQSMRTVHLCLYSVSLGFKRVFTKTIMIKKNLSLKTVLINSKKNKMLL